MRITIKYFDGYPELEAELAQHSPRARAERLRFLAAMGLSFMRANQPAPATQSPKPKTRSKTSSTAKSITRSVFSQADE